MMTRNKAQKQAVRNRMAKTGERYTTARHYHLDQHLNPATNDHVEPDPQSVELPPRVAEPGMSDEAVQRGTGKSWDEWFLLLDGWQATERTHKDIAQHVADRFEISGWWAQTVTVGYERARGMRALYESKDGFSASVSKTFSVPVERLFTSFVEEAERDSWLESETLRQRTAQPSRSARFDVVSNGTRLEVYFTAKGPEKSSAALQHVKLPTEEDVATWRAFWKARLNRLSEVLSDTD